MYATQLRNMKGWVVTQYSSTMRSNAKTHTYGRSQRVFQDAESIELSKFRQPTLVSVNVCIMGVKPPTV
jgi:hypothetical protein